MEDVCRSVVFLQNVHVEFGLRAAPHVVVFVTPSGRDDCGLVVEHSPGALLFKCNRTLSNTQRLLLVNLLMDPRIFGLTAQDIENYRSRCQALLESYEDGRTVP